MGGKEWHTCRYQDVLRDVGDRVDRMRKVWEGLGALNLSHRVCNDVGRCLLSILLHHLLLLLLLGVLGILCAMDGIPAPCYLGNSLALLRHNEVLASSSNAYA